jgi:NAD(P)H-flavin reductase
MRFKLLITNEENVDVPQTLNRRIEKQDLVDSVGDSEGTVCFVCGPPGMTDEFVGIFEGLVGAERVFCEKWW